MCTYFVYLIKNHPKDGQPYVGCTKNLKDRMKQHGVSLNDCEILFQSEYIIVASMMEQQEQELILGKADGYFYHIYASEERCQAVADAKRGVSSPLKGIPKGPFSEEHCQAIGDAKRGIVLSLNHRQKIGDKLRGGKRSPEQCHSISDGLKGYQKSPEHCQSIGDANRGSVWITDGIIDKHVKPEQLLIYLDRGWIRGRTRGIGPQSPEHRQKNSDALIGSLFINNGITSKRVHQEHLQSYLDNGWQRGRLSKKLAA